MGVLGEGGQGILRWGQESQGGVNQVLEEVENLKRIEVKYITHQHTQTYICMVVVMNLPKPGKGIWGRKGGAAGGAWGKVGGGRGGLLALLPLLDELNVGEAPDLAVRRKEKM